MTPSDVTVNIRAFDRNDIDTARALWAGMPGVGLSAADEPTALVAFLERNPGLSAVALDDTRIVGTLLCGHDGRRGLLHHLAVDPARRRRGLGRALVNHSLSALQAAGIAKCHLLVFADNIEGQRFWQAVGAEARVELDLYSLPCPPGVTPR